MLRGDRPAPPERVYKLRVTHLHRLSRRLGLIGPKVSAEKAHDLLPEIVPPQKRPLPDGRG